MVRVGSAITEGIASQFRFRRSISNSSVSCLISSRDNDPKMSATITAARFLIDLEISIGIGMISP
jgi:hypothetical protein